MSKPLILIVDDVDFFIEVEKGFLKNSHADIITAKNGEEALTAIALNKPSLVYMDVNMPVMDGITCCRRIKQDPQLKDIPVVMVYAANHDMDDAQVKSSGCDAILHKPVDRKQFLEVGRGFLPEVDRRSQRVPCQMTVEFSLNGQDCQATGVDISSGGMYVQYREDVPQGERVRVAFFMPTVSPVPVETWAEIAWVNSGFPRDKMNLPQGFGLEFKLLKKEFKEVIEKYIEINS